MAAQGALAGVRVIDFGQYVAGPMAAMYLADNGADVVRVDPPGGARWKHPANAILQRSKRSVVLDLKQDTDRATARRLVETADVVIEGFRPGVMRRLGLAPDSFGEVNDRLIWCSIPGFSAQDERAGLEAWEGIVSAATGLYPPHTLAIEGPPVFSPIPLASTFAAMMAAHRIAAALISRHRYGRGSFIEVSLYHAAFQAMGGSCELPLSRVYGDPTLARLSPLSATGFETADGTLFQISVPVRGIQALVDRLELGVDLLSLDAEGIIELRALLVERFKERTAMEWEKFTQEEVGLASGPILSSKDWLADAHAYESKTVIEVSDPELGSTRQAGFPVLLTATAPDLQFARRATGEDQDDVLEELKTLTTPASSGVEPNTDPALSGVCVLDSSTLLAGPTTGRILAQYGASVVKIEKASVARGEADPLTDEVIYQLSHRTMNSGKRMMYLDIKHPQAAPALEKLFAWADVVHHNYTLGSVSRLGFAPDQIRRYRADAIVSSTSLHSRGGFREAYRGHEDLAQATTGVALRSGGTEEPRSTAMLLNDHGAGHLSVFGILLALFHRYRTGAAQEVNMALSRMATLHQFPFMLAYEGRVWNEPAGPYATGYSAADRLYRASDSWFYLACPTDRFRERIAALKGCEQTANFSEQDLERQLENHFALLPVSEAVDQLAAAGITAHRYLDIIEAVTEPVAFNLKASAFIEHPGLGEALGIAHPLFGDGEDTLLAARRPGMDTAPILEEQGFSAAEIMSMHKAGAIAFGENPGVETSLSPGFWLRPSAVLSHASAPSVEKAVSRVKLNSI